MVADVACAIDTLLSMPVEDRLKVVEAVWDSLPEQAGMPVSPDQRAELNRRLDAYEADPDELLTWDEVVPKSRD